MKLVGLLWSIAALATVWLFLDTRAPRPKAPQARAEVRAETGETSEANAESAALLPRSAAHRAPPEERIKEQVQVPESDQARPGLSDAGVILEEQFRLDQPATPDSYKRQLNLERLFKEADLGDAGQLSGVDCKGTICRGEVEIAHRSQDSIVFGRTFLSREFAVEVPGAVSIADRKTLEDGRVVATFFIHPDSSLEALPERGDEEQAY